MPATIGPEAETSTAPAGRGESRGVWLSPLGSGTAAHSGACRDLLAAVKCAVDEIQVVTLTIVVASPPTPPARPDGGLLVARQSQDLTLRARTNGSVAKFAGRDDHRPHVSLV